MLVGAGATGGTDVAVEGATGGAGAAVVVVAVMGVVVVVVQLLVVVLVVLDDVLFEGRVVAGVSPPLLLARTRSP